MAYYVATAGSWRRPNAAMAQPVGKIDPLDGMCTLVRQRIVELAVE
jgi:hypothetical protein